MDVYIEKWVVVEVDTEDEVEAVAKAYEAVAGGRLEFAVEVSLEGGKSPKGRMDTALRLIATLPFLRDRGDSQKLADAVRIAKQAIPKQHAACVVSRRRRTVRPVCSEN